MPLPTDGQEPIWSTVSFQSFASKFVKHVLIWRYLFSAWLPSSVPFNRLGNEIAVQKSRLGSCGSYECALFLWPLTGHSFVSKHYKDTSDLAMACTWMPSAADIVCSKCFLPSRFRMESCFYLGVLFYCFLNCRMYLAVWTLWSDGLVVPGHCSSVLVYCSWSCFL